MIWSAQRPVTGRSVFFILLGFFGAVMAVNAVFVYSALNSWSGLSTQNAYSEGLAYNKQLSAADTQNAMSWQVATTFKPLDGKQATLAVTFRDRRGIGVNGLAVGGTLTRPTQLGLDQDIVLTPVSDGVYRANVELPLFGVWNLAVVARRNGAVLYRLEQRLWLEPPN